MKAQQRSSSAGGDQVVAQHDRQHVDHRRVADAHARRRRFLIRGPDVDPEIVEPRRAVAILVAHQVDRLAPDHAGHVAAARQDADPLSDQHRHVPAADAPERQGAVAVDVGDDQPDLVDVAAEDDLLRSRCHGAPQPRDRVAVHIGRHLGAKLRRFCAPDARRRDLVVRRPRRLQQSVQERPRFVAHRRPPPHAHQSSVIHRSRVCNDRHGSIAHRTRIGAEPPDRPLDRAQRRRLGGQDLGGLPLTMEDRGQQGN